MAFKVVLDVKMSFESVQDPKYEKNRGFLKVFGHAPRRLGASWGVWGASWERLGASWEALGPSWGRLGAVLGRLGAVSGQSRGSLGPQSLVDALRAGGGGSRGGVGEG